MVKVIKYPDFVIGNPYSDNRDITDNIKARNLLSVRISNSNDKILCVMMNPSIADSQQSDRTVNKVLNLLNGINNNVGIIEITNLFPVYKTKSSELHASLQELIKKIGIDSYNQLIQQNDELFQLKAESIKKICMG